MKNDDLFNLDKLEKIIVKYDDGSEDFTVLKKDMEIVRRRSYDKFLYLGVIGSFSSGKSTFINSLIGKNILPTKAIQGTTVAASILKRSDEDDLEIKYLNGKLVRYSLDAEYMENNYAGKLVENIVPVKESVFKRIIIFFKRLFGIGREKAEIERKILLRNRLTDIYRRIISTEQIASDIEYITYEIDDNNIRYDIALVDTPGTESLNSRHTDVTKNAIDNICDALVVIIPYDKPVSQDLIIFIQSNIEDYSRKCIFAVTKIELIDDRDELYELLDIIKVRLSQGLQMENPIVIPMPTLLHLKQVDNELKTTLFDDIEDDIKQELLQLFDQGMSQLYDILSEQRSEYIKDRIEEIYNRILERLNEKLCFIVERHNKINEELEKYVVEDISEFLSKSLENAVMFVERQCNNCDLKVNDIKNILEKYKQIGINKIENCTNAEEIIQNLEEIDFESIYADIKKIVTGFENKVENEKRKKLKEIEEEYYIEYQICNLKGKMKSREVFTNLQNIQDAITNISEQYSKFMEIYRKEIQDSRKGLIKKVKNLFSDQTNDQKIMVKSGINDLFSIYEQDIIECWNSVLEEYFINLKNCMQEAIEEMIQLDQNRINNYVSKTTNEIKINLKERDEILKDIDSLQCLGGR